MINEQFCANCKEFKYTVKVYPMQNSKWHIALCEVCAKELGYIITDEKGEVVIDENWLPKSRKCFTIHLYANGDIILMPEENSYITPMVEGHLKQIDAFLSELRDGLISEYDNPKGWSE